MSKRSRLTPIWPGARGPAVAMLAGGAGISSAPGWEESAKRLVDILIAGVRLPIGQ